LTSALRVVARHPVKSFTAAITAFRLGYDAGHAHLRHLAYLAEALVLADWCTNDSVEHLHVHFGTNPATVAMLMHQICGVPFSFTVHGPEEFDCPVQLGLTRKISAAAFVVAVSSFGRSQLLRWAHADEWSKIAVVPCGIDEAYAMMQADLPPSGSRLICIARLSEQKGHLLLLEAAAELRRRGVAFEIVLVGDGPLRGKIQQEIVRRGLEQSVVLTGTLSQQEIRSRLKDSRVFVLPSFAEGLPVVLMEALAIGRPVLSTFVAGIPELVTPDVGWLVPAGDAHALAEAMHKALTSSDEALSEMGRAGRQRALERHHVANSAAILESLMVRSAAQREQSPLFVPAPFPELEGDPT
jgi:glycosyltransferase involved in cell wall biosynthesis